MIVWFDAVTAKEPLLFDAIATELEKLGHEVIFTCREYDYVSSLFNLLEREVKILGKHGGGTLYGKLIAGNDRIRMLADYIQNLEKKPDIHIAFACPESTRVAFGLGIPVINVNDSPHAKAVGKLTIPLTKYLVYSSSIGKENWKKLGATDEQLYSYDGIDEVAWLLNFSPKEDVFDTLNLEKNEEFIVARPEESSAAYMLDRQMVGQTLLDEILVAIFEDYNGKAVVFPRYKSQKEALLKKFGDHIIIPPKAVDTLSLYYYSDLCITGGATMAREAAALGTPSISYYPNPLEVLEYITTIGIPLFSEYTLEAAIARAKDLLSNPVNKAVMRNQVQSILEKLESPTDKIVEILRQQQ